MGRHGLPGRPGQKVGQERVVQVHAGEDGVLAGGVPQRAEDLRQVALGFGEATGDAGRVDHPASRAAVHVIGADVDGDQHHRGAVRADERHRGGQLRARRIRAGAPGVGPAKGKTTSANDRGHSLSIRPRPRMIIRARDLARRAGSAAAPGAAGLLDDHKGNGGSAAQIFTP